MVVSFLGTPALKAGHHVASDTADRIEHGTLETWARPRFPASTAYKRSVSQDHDLRIERTRRKGDGVVDVRRQTQFLSLIAGSAAMFPDELPSPSSAELEKFLGNYQDRNPLPLVFAVVRRMVSAKKPGRQTNTRSRWVMMILAARIGASGFAGTNRYGVHHPERAARTIALTLQRFFLPYLRDVLGSLAQIKVHPTG